MEDLLTNHHGVEVEAWWSMEMAPGVNPCPGRVPELELLTPETEFRMAAEHEGVFSIMMIRPRVYASRALYGPKGSSRRFPRRSSHRRAPPPLGRAQLWRGAVGPPITCPFGYGSLPMKYFRRNSFHPIPRILVFWPFCNKQT